MHQQDRSFAFMNKERYRSNEPDELFPVCIYTNIASIYLYIILALNMDCDFLRCDKSNPKSSTLPCCNWRW